MLMASPALPIPMTRYGWICPIHHQYHFGAGRIEKVELNYSDLQQDIGYGRNRRARTECTNDFPTKASAARSAQPLSEFRTKLPTVCSRSDTPPVMARLMARLMD
jgi:hypothetical protein